MDYNMSDKAYRVYVNQLIVYLLSKEDGSLIYVITEQQRAALKTIIHGDFGILNGFELTFCTCFQWIRKNNLPFK